VTECFSSVNEPFPHGSISHQHTHTHTEFLTSEEKENKNKIEKKVLCRALSLHLLLFKGILLSALGEPLSFVATERADRYLIMLECVSSSLKKVLKRVLGGF